jgi:hypothetical protein
MKFIARLASNSYRPLFQRVLQLPMAPGLPNNSPTVYLKYP